ncbi:hypothetical protein [Undibacterium umbellatum]|uniref:Transmembrane protein n=1 Tax=Undibacterium umbellatum TaxID=2762300 RepID=A0ABR6ZDK5_9BURK|nr:hypothetical protein [Undibacterium umbellatum]MBC3909793.1 hypothetical protein [Undibacterium umbellatum]
MREKQAKALYFRELFATLGLYCLFVSVSSIYADSVQAGPLRSLLIASPILPALLMVWTIIRQFQRMDEYVRIWSLENLGMGAAFTAAFSLSYGFMEITGFPRLSMFATWSLIMGSWGVITCLRSWKEKSQ